MLQGVIGRLAGNSASCKTWCVSLSSALAVVVAQSGNRNLLIVAALPIVLFMFLDAYYLGLERRFRTCYETFVQKLHNGTASVEDAFLIAPRLKVRGLFLEAGQALLSFSIWPFYLGLAGILWFLSTRLAPPLVDRITM
jgi:hypothetical protein